jgi:hypothetical protein
VRIVAALSDPAGHYDRLRCVFERSAEAAMPGIEIEVVAVGAQPSRQHAMAACFLAAAERAVDIGGEVAVADVDLMFLREIRSAFDAPFDAAVTVRETAMRFNTGLWFYRSDGRAFVERWRGWTRRMLAGERRTEVRRYGGIDQAALAAAVAEGGAGVLELPCREWNATQSEWAAVDVSMRVVHVKSALRRAVLGRERPRDPALLPLIERFHEWESA